MAGVCVRFLPIVLAVSTVAFSADRSVDDRVSALLAKVTVAARAGLPRRATRMETQPNARLGIPAIKMADGPAGVRSWAGPSASTNTAAAPGLSTSFPAGVALAATWDIAVVEQVARAIAQETKALGRDMILAPT